MSQEQRVKNLCQILLEMADGNFSYRVPRTKEDDILESLTVLVNWLAEEMEESLFHSGYVNPHAIVHYTVQSTFILNENGAINDFSPNIPNLLGVESDRLPGLDFSEILGDESMDTWRATIDSFLQSKINHTFLLLNFKTSKELSVPALCNIFRLFKNKKILVSLFNAVIRNKDEVEGSFPESGYKHTNIYNRQDMQVIQSVYDYILAHGNVALPKLGKLARIFGTNEFKLKAGFRYLFKTSIYRFYTDVRLKKAQLLIKNTGIPLKEIAYMSGYNSYPNFYRAFKIKYECTPNSIRKRLSK